MCFHGLERSGVRNPENPGNSSNCASGVSIKDTFQRIWVILLCNIFAIVPVG